MLVSMVHLGKPIIMSLKINSFPVLAFDFEFHGAPDQPVQVNPNIKERSAQKSDSRMLKFFTEKVPNEPDEL